MREMKKKTWARPVTIAQQFVANEYVAACGDSGTVYKFKCDMPSGNLYEESNGVDGLQTSAGIGYEADTLLYTNVRGCNLTHEASSLDTFTNGYAVSGRGSSQTVTSVIIWYEPVSGWNTYDIHATTNVNMSTWETAKS